jgi:hypothetical protein
MGTRDAGLCDIVIFASIKHSDRAAKKSPQRDPHWFYSLLTRDRVNGVSHRSL